MPSNESRYGVTTEQLMEQVRFELENQLSKLTGEEQLEDLIAKYASEAIEDAISTEIMLYFRVGNGREVIKKAVCEKLDLYYESNGGVAS